MISIFSHNTEIKIVGEVWFCETWKYIEFQKQAIDL